MDDWMTAPEWTTKHGYFLQMGGFKITYSEEDEKDWDEFIKVSDFRSWIRSRAYQYHSRLDNSMWDEVLQFDKLRWLLKEHKIDFPTTTTE